MKIDARLDYIPTATIAAQGGAAPASFQAAFEQAVEAQAAAVEKPEGPARVMTQAERNEEIRAANEAVLAAFREYMSKTPVEHLRERILEEMGISEEDLARMPPEQRQAVEAEIADRIKERMLDQARAKEEEANPFSTGAADAGPPVRSPTAGSQLGGGLIAMLNNATLPAD